MIEAIAAGVGVIGLLLNGHIWYKMGSIETAVTALQNQFASITQLSVNGGKRNGKRRHLD